MSLRSWQAAEGVDEAASHAPPPLDELVRS